MKTTKMMAILLLVIGLDRGSYASLPEGWDYVPSDGLIPSSQLVEYDNETQTWTIRGAPLYVYTCLSGDGQITARIANSEGGLTWPHTTYAGVMMRNDPRSDLKEAYLELWQIEEPAYFQYTFNISSPNEPHRKNIGVENDFYPWLRIQRSGDKITGYYSSDGSDWKELGPRPLLMSTNIFVGLWVYSHNFEASVMFDNVNVESFNEPNDEYYNQQWHLNNTGQGGGKPDTDADVQEAWSFTSGSDDIVIAVLDEGIETGHPDLNPNLFVNTGEIPGNGLDDDENGYVDDISGWDFWDGDNDPNPELSNENHGTAIAGVALARGNNDIGVAGVAYTSRLLPVRIMIPSTEGPLYYPGRVAGAILYAAGLNETGDRVWRGADIICICATFFEINQRVNDALFLASTYGRNGLGCPIFVASGNIRDGLYDEFSTNPIEAWSGNWSWIISYEKDESNTDGEDTVCISEFVNSDGTTHRFDSKTPSSDWNLSPGEKGWYVEDNPAHAYGTSRYQLRAESIGNNEKAYLMAPKFYVADDIIPGISFKLWRSCHFSDKVKVYLWNDDTGDNWKIREVDGAVSNASREVQYPANLTSTIAVGASTNFGYRSHKSTYGTSLDFMAPSDGGTLGIYTTDRTGSDGYSSGDYKSDFGGTSAACPFAAGVGALILSKNPNLTGDEVFSIIRNTCDQIGDVEYPDGWNEYYGYGQINAYNALLSLSEIDIESSQ